MIFSALDITQSSLNEYFRNRYNQTEDKVIMSTLVNQDGSVGIPESDKIVMTLVNVQEERVTANRNSSKGGADPVHLYLYVLFSSYFVENNYGESLKFLSGVISFFQSHKILNHQNTPDLDSGIDKLSFEIYNQDLQNMSHLWGTVGGKYLPSILYKMRMISIDENLTTGPSVQFLGFGANN